MLFVVGLITETHSRFSGRDIESYIHIDTRKITSNYVLSPLLFGLGHIRPDSNWP